MPTLDNLIVLAAIFNVAIEDVYKRQVLKWETMMEQNYGLMFIGDVGSGKSYMAACIANACLLYTSRCV